MSSNENGVHVVKLPSGSSTGTGVGLLLIHK